MKSDGKPKNKVEVKVGVEGKIEVEDETKGKKRRVHCNITHTKSSKNLSNNLYMLPDAIENSTIFLNNNNR